MRCCWCCRATPVIRPLSTILALVLLLLCLAFIGGVVYGWIIGFVPFVPCATDTPLVDDSALPEDHPIRLGLTGIVALAVPTIRRRYRNRPSVLVLKEGKINFLVDRWRTQYFRRQRSYASVVSLDPADVSAIVRGTAYLVSKEMPAIRLDTPQGPLLLTFAAPEFRDRAYNALAALISDRHSSKSGTDTGDSSWG